VNFFGEVRVIVIAQHWWFPGRGPLLYYGDLAHSKALQTHGHKPRKKGIAKVISKLRGNK